MKVLRDHRGEKSMWGRLSLVFLILLSLVGCKTSQKIYFKEIERLGFIPFTMPVSNISTGTVIREEPSFISPVVPPSRCFPNEFNGQPTHLRWVSGVTVPSVYRNLFFTFDGSLNSLVATGTPGFQFNLSSTKVRTVKLEIREAQIEMLDQIAIQETYKNVMSNECREIVTAYPFILEALQVTSMSFEFFDAFGGKIQVDSAHIAEFALFDADIQWYIEQGYKLVITSPKFIAYRLAQLRPEDDGFVRLVSSQVKKGEYIWFEGKLSEDASSARGFERLPRKKLKYQ